jgi:hypothetical protein
METTCIVKNCIDVFVSIAVIPIFRFYFYLKNNCWRISLTTANRLGIHQISNATAEDRYPEIFSYVQYLLSDNDYKKILSFGCSIGIECHTLRKYFLKAEICGYDIDENNIVKAKNNNNDKKIYFYSKFEDVNCRKYNAVFVMSVLCRSPQSYNKNDLSKIYSFIQFEQQILLIDQLI